MKRYIKSSTDPKILTLDMFDVDEYDFKTPYAEMHCVDYILKINGYRIKIYMGFGKIPYSISFTYPSGYTGEVSGFKTAQDAVDYLNDKEWWNFKEPSEEEVRRAIEDEWNPPRENYGYYGVSSAEDIDGDLIAQPKSARGRKPIEVSLSKDVDPKAAKYLPKYQQVRLKELYRERDVDGVSYWWAMDPDPDDEIQEEVEGHSYSLADLKSEIDMYIKQHKRLGHDY